MSIKFLNILQSQSAFNNTFYFECMSDLEVKSRLQIAGILNTSSNSASNLQVLKSLYIQSVQNFTDNEKKSLTQFFSLILSSLSLKAPGLMPSVPYIGIIKLSDIRKLDWKFPYTIDNYIVLPQMFVDECVSKARLLTSSLSQKSVKHWNLVRPRVTDIYPQATTLAHEIFHITQRYPTKKQMQMFDKVYTEWRFTKINPRDVRVGTSGKPYIPVTNPDGCNYSWAVSIWADDKLNWFTPVLMLPSINHNPTGILVSLDPQVNGQLIMNHWNYISKYSSYMQLFSEIPVSQLYHPNEIMATLLADWLIADKVYTQFADNDFYQIMGG